MNLSPKSKQSRKRSGQAMVEFALAMPLVMLILVAILFFGRYFFVAQVLLNAVQQGAKVAAGTPNLSQQTIQETVLGFDSSGAQSTFSSSSAVYGALAAAGLLSNIGTGGNSGNLPTGSQLQIVLPGQTDVTGFAPPDGTIEVLIQYPFELIGNVFNGSSFQVAVQDYAGPLVRFKNFTITQRAVVAQEIYQNTN